MTTLETLLGDPDSAGVWNLVPDRSSVTFKVKNMWGLLTVKGAFTDFSGDGQLTAKGAVFGRVDIMVASLRTGINRRDQHLLAADFFDADRFPQMSVVVTALAPTSGKAADLRADFTVKGQSAPVPLPVTITDLGDGAVRISGEAQLDRSRFGLGWNKLGAIGATATASADVVFVRAPQ
ncbi:YceI family protein [Mycobacterium spongiae]|uniref:YceI family protein n=1 Tax=Mycobacterium spongiae TaxID=886343 RepID=A0A975JW20_9MYCO|nr:YceI family protein [Mycobacterium spongiae]QUR66726.1 YceI family protein [Mycobacterium spongiae]